MKCLRPIHIYNASRFLVPTNRDRLCLDVPCGKCANCQRNNFSQWYFRAYKHFEDCVTNHGNKAYMLFDTLTYDDVNLPHLSDYPEFGSLPSHLNHSCFNHEHIRLFNVRLRRRLEKMGLKSGVYNYFVTSEYGHDKTYFDSRGRLRRGTVRPHYHVLFFVYGDIEPLQFSCLVGKSWLYGRTDGLPYKPSQYVMSNVFSSLSPLARRKVMYVSKYIQKQSSFDKILGRRISSVLYDKYGFDFDKQNTPEARLFRTKLYRLVSQFHRQSQGFGLFALNEVDEVDLMKCGFFKMYSGKGSLYTRIPIPNYFLRKLCYEKVFLSDGFSAWSIKPEKAYLLNLRNEHLKVLFKNQIQADSFNYGVELPDIDKLVDYAVSYRGRFVSDSFDFLTLFDKQKKARLFVYGSVADKNHFGLRFVSNRYLGYKDNYLSADGAVIFPLRSFIQHESFNQLSVPGFNGFDEILDKIEAIRLGHSDEMQYQYDHLQHLRDAMKSVYCKSAL